MRRTRTVFWKPATSTWFNDQNYRDVLIYYIDSPDDRDQYDEDRYMCSALITFYSNLFIEYSDDRVRLNETCAAFHYHWWRGFLLSYVLCSKREWDLRAKTEEHKKQLPFHQPLNDILTLDLICCDAPFDPQTHPYYEDKGMETNDTLFPGLQWHNSAFDRRDSAISEQTKERQLLYGQTRVEMTEFPLLN